MLVWCGVLFVLLWGNDVECVISEWFVKEFGVVVIVLLKLLLLVVVGLIDGVVVMVGVDIGLVYIVVVLKCLMVELYNFVMVWWIGGYWLLNVVNFGMVG